MPPASSLQSIPRFSLRTILVFVSLCAVFFVIMGYAYRGYAWAIVITVGVVSIVVTLAVQAAFYALVSTFGKIVGSQISPARTSQGGLQSSTEDQAAPKL